MLDPDDAPAERAEDRLDPLPKAFPHDTVKALPVVIDDPPAVPKVVFPAFLQAFVDIAFVEFRITDQSHHAALRCLAKAVRVNVILTHRGKRRHRHAEPDRPGREIHVVDIRR